MKDREKKNESRGRRAYTKPKLRSIDLVADQVLAVGCKLSTGGSAPAGFTCTATGCSAAGS